MPGCAAIPRELHEAADLEGPERWQRLRWVILPPLAPVMLLNLLLITIYTLNTFDMILPLTGGGPARRTEVVSLYMYRSAFFDLDSGKRPPIAVVMLGINALAGVGRRPVTMRRAAGRPCEQSAHIVAGMLARAGVCALADRWRFCCRSSGSCRCRSRIAARRLRVSAAVDSRESLAR